MKSIHIYVLNLLSLFCFHMAWARSIPGRAYAGIGGDMEAYDLSKTNGGDVYEELALRKD